MPQFRLKIGIFYYADPEYAGLTNTWTSTASDALLFTLDHALEAIRSAVNSETLRDKRVVLEPVGATA